MHSLGDNLRTQLARFDSASRDHVVDVTALILSEAVRNGASDVHLHPAKDALTVSWRVDGVLHEVASLPSQLAPNVVARLKVLARLLTYRQDQPQEGRIPRASGDVEMRVSTFPTLHGEKAVVRMFASSSRLRSLDDLGLPPELVATMRQVLRETSGLILVSGPAGSGKTTTIYACLRELAKAAMGRRSLVSIEDPIEEEVAGVAQSQVNSAVSFDLARGLRFLMRQDPEVIAVGEIRDRDTADAVFQASLTGHLVLSTFHAGSACGTIGRLLDLGIEPYQLRSGILAVLALRLVRVLCACSAAIEDERDLLGLPVRQGRRAMGCAECHATGYIGRRPLAELLIPERGDVGRSILEKTDVARIEAAAIRAGMTTRWRHACAAVETGLTSPEEVRRALGFRSSDDSPHS